MRKLVLVVVIILAAITTVVACTFTPTPEPASGERPASAPGGLLFSSPIGTPSPGVTATPEQPVQPVEISLAFPEPVVVNQPATLDISILARKEIIRPAYSVVLRTEGGEELQVYTATLPSLAPNELHQLSQTLLIPSKDDFYLIVVSLTASRTGATYHQALFFAVASGVVTINPTPRPPDAPPTIEFLGTPRGSPTPPGTVIPPPTPTSSSSAERADPHSAGGQVEAGSQASAQCTPEYGTIWGRLRIPARGHLYGAGTDPIPSQYTKVMVYDRNSYTTAAGDTQHGNPPDVFLGWNVTGVDGRWRIDGVNLRDWDCSHVDVYAIYSTTNTDDGTGDLSRTVRNPDANGAPYAFPMKVFTCDEYPTGQCGSVIDDVLGSGTTGIQALELFDDANRAHDYVYQHNGSRDPHQVHIYWSRGRESYRSCSNVSCFQQVPGSPNGYGVFIQDALSAMPDVTVHEIGHAYMYNLMGSSGSSCPNGTHNTWVNSNRQCAWEEGWADFLPTVVNNDVCYDDNSGYPPCSASIPDANLETSTWGDGRDTGATVEGRVAGTLLDMHDTSGSPALAGNEGWDNADGYGLWRTWSIISPATESNPEQTLIDFWVHWNSFSNFATASPIAGPLYQNTIVTRVFVPYQ